MLHLNVTPFIYLMNSIKTYLLRGTLDNQNPLSILRANELVWNKIFTNVDEWYQSHIIKTENAYNVISNRFFYPIQFPEPTGININMMPIRICDPSSYPDFIKPYLPLIRACCRFTFDDKIIYLTIQESEVPIHQTQRRSGLHIERPGILEQGGKMYKEDFKNPEYRGLAWGSGLYCGDIPVDGIFMASSVSNTCQIWPVQIENPHEVTDTHGGLEPMRPYLGEPYKIQKNELVWLTDTTPHEALPVEQPVYRQFFRLVMGRISTWYSQHNTPNPTGLLPDAPISDENKFELMS